MTDLLAIALAAAAAALLAGRRSNVLAARLGYSRRVTAQRRQRTPPSTAPPGTTRPGKVRAPAGSASSLRFGRIQLLLATAAGATAGAVVAAPGGAIIGGLAPPVAMLFWARRRAHASQQARQTDVADACLALASELRAGMPAQRAIAAVAQEWPGLFAQVAGRAAVGGDPAEALRATAARPGAGSLTAVAAAWDVSARTGAPLSSVLTAVADSLRAESTVRQEAQAQLATVRATARLLALLPVGTLLLFSRGEGAPISFLLQNPYGVACLMVALVFIAAGLGWVERTSRLAMRTPWAR